MTPIGAPQEKYFKFCKSLKPFFASISDQQPGQVLPKSNKSTYPINSFERR